MMKNIIAILILSLLSCTPHPDKSGSHDIRVLSLKGPSAISLVNMISDLDSISGKAIDYQIFNEPNQVRARLLKGEAEFAFLPMNLAANLYNKGLPYQLIMIPVWGSLYLCGNNPDIKDLKDLLGQKVNMMGRGLNPDIIFRYLLKQVDLNPEKDLALDYSFPTHIDLANAVSAGLVDLAVLSEPQLSLVMQKNPSIIRLIDLNEEWIIHTGYAMAQTALVVRKEFASDNRGLVNQMIKKFSESGHKALSDPKHTALKIVEYNILPDAKLAREAIQHCGIRPVIYNETMKPLQTYLEVFYNFNPETIGGKIPDEGFIYSK